MQNKKISLLKIFVIVTFVCSFVTCGSLAGPAPAQRGRPAAEAPAAAPPVNAARAASTRTVTAPTPAPVPAQAAGGTSVRGAATAAARPSATAPATATRTPVAPAAAAQTPEPEPEPAAPPPAPVQETPMAILEPLPMSVVEIEVSDRSGAFTWMFEDTAFGAATSDETPLQRMIREQRERLGMLATGVEAGEQRARLGTNTAIACDESLRVCMARTCGGDDFRNCFNDGDTEWGMKMNNCRRETECTAEEFTTFAQEIREDRIQNQRLDSFNKVIACGMEYNNCFRNACGGTAYTNCIMRGGHPMGCRQHANNFEPCWGRAAEMRATEQCRQVQQRCLEQDSGMERRMADIIGSMRVDLERNILNWERDLYALRDRIRDMCMATQGMFDERSFTCVYTAYIYANPNNHDGRPVRLGDRRLHAGEEFVCEPEWFSVDITTHMENAFRATRRETAATAAIMGAGMGMAAGAVASGAVGRAVETARTAAAARNAEQGLRDGETLDGTSSTDAPQGEIPQGETPQEPSGDMLGDDMMTLVGAQAPTPVPPPQADLGPDCFAMVGGVCVTPEMATQAAGALAQAQSSPPRCEIQITSSDSCSATSTHPRIINLVYHDSEGNKIGEGCCITQTNGIANGSLFRLATPPATCQFEGRRFRGWQLPSGHTDRVRNEEGFINAGRNVFCSNENLRFGDTNTAQPIVALF